MESCFARPEKRRTLVEAALAILLTVLATAFGISNAIGQVDRSDVGERKSPNAGSVSAKQVRDLIALLGDAQRQVRIKAEQDLLKLGPAALKHLPPSELLSGSAVRQAVLRVRIKLEQTAARKSIATSTVTKTGEFSLDELVDSITKQTGNRIRIGDVPESLRHRTIQVNWNSTPFWKAIEQIEGTGVEAGFPKASGTLLLNASVEDSPAAQTRLLNAFRVDLSSVSQRPVPDSDSTLLSCSARIMAEPRLRPLFLRYVGDDFSLQDKNGRRFDLFTAGSKIEVPLGDGGREARIEMQFLCDGPVPGKLALKGTAGILVAAREEPIRFQDLARLSGVTRRRGGVSATVRKVDLGSENKTGTHTARVELRVHYESGKNAFESHQTWVFHNSAYLQSPTGKRFPVNDGFETLFQSDGAVGLEYRFADLPDDPRDWSFVYVAPTLLVNASLMIEIDDVRLDKLERQSTSTQPVQ